MAGFRFGAQGSVDESNLYVWGAFYSSDGSTIWEGMVEVPLDGSPFVPVVSATQVVSQTSASVFEGSVLSPSACYLVSRSSTVRIMSLEGASVKEIDSGAVFYGMWGGRDRVLYILGRDTTCVQDVMIYDVLSGKTTKIASLTQTTTLRYSYPILSTDGTTVVVAQYDYARRTMTYYAATEENGFTLSSLLQNVAIGPLRLSSRGDFYAYLSSDGLLVGYISSGTAQ